MPEKLELTTKEIILLQSLLDKLSSNQIATLKQLIINKSKISTEINQLTQLKNFFFNINPQLSNLSPPYNLIKIKTEELHNKSKEVDELVNANTQQATTLNKLITEKTKLLNEKEEELNTLTKSIQDVEEQVTSLLPASLAIGLSASYKEAQSNYKHSSYKVGDEGKWKRKNKQENLLDLLYHYLKNFGRYFTFLAPLLLIVIINLEPNWFPQIHKVTEIKDIFIRIILILPLAIISFFGWSNIKRNNFLLEEYHHKERIMSLYQGISGKITNEESLSRLNQMIIASIYSNPNIKQNKTSLKRLETILNVFTKTTNKEQLIEENEL